MRPAALAPALVATACTLAIIPARGATPVEGVLVALDDKVTLTVPDDLARELRSLGPRGDMLTLADGGDLMVVVVYRRGVAPAPNASEALRIHADELEHALGNVIRRPGRLRLLGRDQDAVMLTLLRDGIEREAWVVAVEAGGRTIVASAVTVKGSPNAAAWLSVLKGIRLK